MNGNTASGGLIVQCKGDLVFAAPNEWFLCADDEYIYYSNRDDGNRLYRKTPSDQRGKVLINKPCSAITLQNDMLYYINENDKKVYRCSKEGKNTVICSNQMTTEFAVLPDGTVYANPDARRICICGENIYFADGGNKGSLFAFTKYNYSTGEKEFTADVQPSYMNVYENDVYYTDRTKANNIFRISPNSNGSKVAVYGQSAELLHVIGDWLYFMSAKKWKRLSLTRFGDAQEV